MLLAGMYEFSVFKFGFQVIIGKVRNMFTITTIDQNVSPHVATQVLTSRIKKEVADIIVSQAITTPSGEIVYSYGDMNIMTEFINNLTSNASFNDLKNPDYASGFTINNSKCTLTTFHISENSNMVMKYNYLDYNTDTNSNNKTAEIYIKRGSIRTLNELKELYDLSWVLNEDGSLKKDYKTICTEDELDWVIDNVKTADEVAFDVETTGLNFFYKGGKNDDCDKLVGICLSWKEDQAVYIPLISNKFECLTEDYVVPRLFPVLAKKKLDGANIMFDIKVAYHYGYYFRCGFDTMQAEFDLDPTGSRGNKSLKAMTRNYIGDETLELDEVLGGSVDGKMIPYLDKDVITIYGCADADYVLKLKHILTKYLQHMKVCTRLDFKMIPVCAIAEYYGNRVDMETLHILSEVNKRDFKLVDATLREYLRIAAKTNIVKGILLSQGYDVNNKEAFEYIWSLPDVDDMTIVATTIEGKNGERIPLNFHSKDDLDIVFFKILGYPSPKVKKRLGKKESLSKDDAYLTNLSMQVQIGASKFMTQDLNSTITEYNYDWVSDKEKVLLSKDEINNCKYPFAIMLAKWRKLDKRQSSFYNRLESLSSNGYYLTENSMTSADTARIINVAQTLQGYIKRLIIPFPNKYEIIFDAMQIEFRVMIGLASNYWEQFTKTLGENYEDLKSVSIKQVADKLNIPWADYHREGGCLLVGKTPATMTKEDRSAVKGPHFAVPYGGNARTIAKDRMAGVIDEQEQNRIIEETEEIMGTWRNKMYPLYKFLEFKRDQAITEVNDINKLPPRLRNDVVNKGGKWGYVDNALGRRRYYNLNYEKTALSFLKGEPDLFSKTICNKLENNEELTQNEKRYWKHYINDTENVVKALIRRSAGNYPIQSLAREYFVLMMTSLFDKLHKEGYMGIGPGKDKVILNMLVHDEGHLQIDYSIHPFKMYGYIIECCMLNLTNYPRIYCGISICNSWYDGKVDLWEAPVEFTFDMAKAYKENPSKFDNEDWQSNPQEYVNKYVKDWIHEYTNKAIQDFADENNIFDLVKFREVNENYFLFVKVGMYTKKFLNKEDDITRDELIILSHNENKELIVRTEKRDIKMSEYIFQYNTTKIQKDNETSNSQKTSEFNDIDSIISEIEDFSVDDLDLDTDYDSNYKELDSINCYWISYDSDNVTELIPETSSSNITPVSDDELVEEEKPKVFSRFIDLAGTLCLDLTNVDRNKVQVVSNYLKSHKDANGQKLMYTVGNIKKFLPYRVSNIKSDELKFIIEGD